MGASIDGRIALTDGGHLAYSLWLPADTPAPCLLEALPYRKDDITASYAGTYERLAGEGGYAVCRIDLRGTGSSSGIADDEYPATEIEDLTQVIQWLARQDWCTGRVGMFGTSYSGFNSLHMAAAGVPELGAVCAFYSSDDRFTDDVHFTGGALRALDVVDYVTYMIAMNALPPVPALWGDGWKDEWRRRIEQTPPWVVEWMSNQVDGPTWRRGSIRTGPDGEGVERFTCPVMLVAGWADGYRNNTFRMVEHLDVPWRLLIGPWSHKDPATARPGPNIDADIEMLAFFDEHLREISKEVAPLRVFVREYTAPAPDLGSVNGRWRASDTWPIAGASPTALPLGAGTEAIPFRSDVGAAAWISCAGGLPWGQPEDQRSDDAWSMTTDWPIHEPMELIGHAVTRLLVKASAPVAYVSAKLCDVAPDGTSVLITRGLLNLSHRGCWPADGTGERGRVPGPLEPDQWLEASVELEATAYRMTEGHRLRLSLAATDWPNIWVPPTPVLIEVDRAASSLELPTVPADGAEPPQFRAGEGPSPPDESVRWVFERDVLARRTVARTHYGDSYRGFRSCEIEDSYDGEVTVNTADPSDAGAMGRARFELKWPEATASAEAELRVASDALQYHVDIVLHTRLDGEGFAERSWHTSIDRFWQ